MADDTPSSGWRGYLKLLRLSNVLTAVSDIWMGMIVASGSLQPPSVCTLLTLTSVCLYLSGMVLNDVFDADEDARLRSNRPIPTGQVQLGTARRLGWGLWISGIVGGTAVSLLIASFVPAIVTLLLATCILAYNRLKAPDDVPAKPFRRAMGPVLMALCRVFNVLLGLLWNVEGLADLASRTTAFSIALGVFVYLVGVTLLASQEATSQKRHLLAFASIVTLAGIAIYAILPLQIGQKVTASSGQWLLLWAVIAMLVGRRFAAALLQPKPRTIQQAVGNSLQCIIIINAAIAWGVAGPFWGLTIFALAPPTWWMARFIPQT